MGLHMDGVRIVLFVFADDVYLLAAPMPPR